MTIDKLDEEFNIAQKNHKERKYDISIPKFRSLHDLGYHKATEALALCHFLGTGMDKDKNIGFNLATELINNTNIGYTALGIMYMTGFNFDSLSEARKEAFNNFQKGHLLNIDTSSYYYANMLMEGTACSVNHDLAKSIIDDLLTNKNSAHYDSYLLSLASFQIIKKQYKESISTLTTSSELGNDKAKTVLGNFFLDGKFIEKDIQKGISLITEAANNQEVSALYVLGYWHTTGYESIKKNLQVAKFYLERGIIKEDINSISLMGLILTEEIVNSENYKEGDAQRAFELLSKGENHNNTNALLGLSVMYFRGIHVPKDINTSREYENKYLALVSKHNPSIKKNVLATRNLNQIILIFSKFYHALALITSYIVAFIITLFVWVFVFIPKAIYKSIYKYINSPNHQERNARSGKEIREICYSQGISSYDYNIITSNRKTFSSIKKHAFKKRETNLNSKTWNELLAESICEYHKNKLKQKGHPPID